MNQPYQDISASLHRRAASQLGGGDRFSIAKATPLRLSLRQSAASDPGNGLATARSLGASPVKRRLRETVGKTDKDFYQFTFGDLTDLRITLRNRSKANIFGEILDSQGQVFTFKGNRLSLKVEAGKAIENFYGALPSGIYYLRVRSSGSGKNTYQLNLSAANTFPTLPDCGCAS